MLNNMLEAIRRDRMVSPGDRVICAVSGGADSMALLWGMWLLKEKLDIRVEAAHFNHGLRGEESRRDEEFVRSFCDFHEIPLHVGSARVTPGSKGLEAAARDARYAFLRSLDGIIATAHTADDNAETVLMHLIRGTGLRGLGGITPKAQRLIRPMLGVTRQQVLEFLRENWIDHVEDSSNASDDFLRNRVRHHVMPLLAEENPSIRENLSAMARRLREDEKTLSEMALLVDPHDVVALRKAPECLRRRALDRLLKESGLPEPTAAHIARAESLIHARRPSAFCSFPGGVLLRRSYDRLEAGFEPEELPEIPLPVGEQVRLESLDLLISAEPARERVLKTDCFTVCPEGPMVIRSRLPGDEITLSGGAKSLKKLFIDRKIPSHRRLSIPVIADRRGVLGVWGIGANLDRTGGDRPVTIRFQIKST